MCGVIAVGKPPYKELFQKVPHIILLEGLPDAFNNERLFPNEKMNMVIIDDLMESASGRGEIEKAFTKYVHHSIMYIVLNVFCQGKKSQPINLNTRYMVLFKNP